MIKGEFVNITHDFYCTPQRLWRAITRHEEMILWYFKQIPSFTAETGFYTEFVVHSGERAFTHQWKIVSQVPEKQIEYEWNYKEYPGHSILSMQIYPSEKGCTLHLRHEVLEDFQDGIPEFELDQCKAGWNYFIKEQLDQFIHGTAS